MRMEKSIGYYRINEDSSFTSMGNIEDMDASMQSQPNLSQQNESDRKSHTGVTKYFKILIGVVGLLLFISALVFKMMAAFIFNALAVCCMYLVFYSASKVGWWKRNYNWLWITTLVVFIGWFISCLSCRWHEYPQCDELYYTVDNTGGMLFVTTIIIVCFCLSWYLSNQDRSILKLAQVLLIGCSAWVAGIMLALSEQEYAFLLVCLAIIPLSIWIVSVCLSIFSRR